MENMRKISSERSARLTADMVRVPEFLHRARGVWIALFSNAGLKALAGVYNMTFDNWPEPFPEGARTHFEKEDFTLRGPYTCGGAELLFAVIPPPADKSGLYCAAYALIMNKQGELRVYSLIQLPDSEMLDIYTVDAFGSLVELQHTKPNNSCLGALFTLAEKPAPVCASETSEFEEDGFRCMATWIPAEGVTKIERWDADGNLVDMETFVGKYLP